MMNVEAFFHDKPVVLDNVPADTRTMVKIFGMDHAEVQVRLFMHKVINVVGTGDITIYLWGDKRLEIELLADGEVFELFDGALPDEIRNAADLEKMALAALTQWMFDV